MNTIRSLAENETAAATEKGPGIELFNKIRKDGDCKLIAGGPWICVTTV